MSLKLDSVQIARPGFRIDASLSVEAGELALLVAPSGVGKSSIIRVILGLEQAASGSIRLDGQEVSQLPTRDRKIGAMLQGSEFLEELTVLDNVALAQKLRGQKWNRARDLARPWLERFGLNDRASFGVDRLSGGERTRLAWARVFVAEHCALVFDEPLTGVDRQWATVFRKTLAEKIVSRPIPALITSHTREGWSDARRGFELDQSDIRRLHEFVL